MQGLARPPQCDASAIIEQGHNGTPSSIVSLNTCMKDAHNLYFFQCQQGGNDVVTVVATKALTEGNVATVGMNPSLVAQAEESNVSCSLR